MSEALPRGLLLAIGLLTRIPVPGERMAGPAALVAAAPWFPLVGLGIGALLAGVAVLAGNPWLAGLMVALAWAGVTGGLHLDGVADLADALGAAHGDRERFLAVLKDAHIGAFGALALICVLLTKLVGAALLPDAVALLLVPAWARLGALFWAQLPPLGEGAGAGLHAPETMDAARVWAAGLFLLGWVLVSLAFSLLALLALWGWRLFLQRRVGGMNGDCLGAGIEYVECALLLAAAWAGT